MDGLPTAGRETSLATLALPLRAVTALAWGAVAIVRLVDVLSRPIMWLDESFYLAEAANLVDHGVFPPPSWGPVVALAHAPTYMLVRGHPLALDIAGRVTAFAAGLAMYGALYVLARRLMGAHWGIYALLFGLLYPPFHHVDNSSVMLYAAAVGWAMIIFTRSEMTGWGLVRTALIIAVATGFRSDGMAAFAMLSIPVGTVKLSNCARRPGGGTLRSALVELGREWFLPYITVLMIFATLAWATAVPDMPAPPGETPGAFEMLPGGRTYFAFEQGAGFVRRFELEPEGLNFWAEGPIIATNLYGSQAENGGNVIRAVLSNPSAWARRVVWNARDFLLAWYEAHGLGASPFMVLFALGIAYLWDDGYRYLVGFIGAMWAATLPYFLLTFWRRGYVDMLGPVVLLTSLYGLRKVLIGNGRRNAVRKAAAILSLAPAVAVGLMAWRYMGDPGLSIALALIMGVLCAPFTRPGRRSARLAGTLVLEVTLLLAAVTSLGTMYRCVLCAYNFDNPDYSYITFAFEHYRGERTCSSDPSLAWYARQEVVWMYRIWRMGSVEEMRDAVCEMRCEHALLLTERGAYLDSEAAGSPMFETEFEDEGVVLARPICP